MKSLPAYSVAYLSDDALIAGGAFGWGGWKRDGNEWQCFSTSGIQVTSLAVLGEQTVAFGMGDRIKPAAAGTLEIWNITSDRKHSPHFYEPNGVRAVAACPAKKLVAWATGHRKVRLWDITTPKPFEFPQSHDCPAVALSADGRSLAVAVDYATKIYDVEKRRERLILKGHIGKVAALAFSPDGRTLLTGSWDQTVRLWDMDTGREQANYKWEIGRIYCVAFAPDGLRLAAGGDLGRVVVWDAE